MMQGHFAVLAYKSNIYCVSNVMNIHYMSLNSQSKMLNLDTNHIFVTRRGERVLCAGFGDI